MKMLEFGDLRQLPSSLGAPVVEMGEIVMDNLASGLLLLYNVFSYCRMCSLTVECVLLL